MSQKLSRRPYYQIRSDSRTIVSRCCNKNEQQKQAQETDGAGQKLLVAENLQASDGGSDASVFQISATIQELEHRSSRRNEEEFKYLITQIRRKVRK